MSKLKASLFSFKAQGTVGKEITYQGRFGRTIARKMPIPTDRKSLLQIYHRWDYQDYADLWHSLTPAEQRQWETNARRKKITGFNYWMSTKLNTLPDLVARWHLDYISNSKTPDTSLNENHGTVFGAYPTPCLIDQGFFFDGLDNYIDCGTDDSLDLLNAFTVELFVKFKAVDKAQILYETNTAIVFHTDASNRLWVYDRHGHYFRTDTDIVVAGVWYHLAATFSGKNGDAITLANGKIYLNAENKVTTVSGNWLPTTHTMNYIGTAYDKTNCMDGLIDEFRIYNRALSAEELKRHSERKYPL